MTERGPQGLTGNRLGGDALTSAQVSVGADTLLPKLTAFASCWQAGIVEHMTGKFFSLRPEVAGGMGPDTVMDRSTHPPVVSRLHFELADWLGDCLVTTFPCFLVLRTTAERLIATAYTGFRISTALVTATDLYWEINPGGTPPELDLLLVHSDVQ